MHKAANIIVYSTLKVSFASFKSLNHSWCPLSASWKICEPNPQPGPWLFILSKPSYTASWALHLYILWPCLWNGFRRTKRIVSTSLTSCFCWCCIITSQDESQSQTKLASTCCLWISLGSLGLLHTFWRTYRLWLGWDFLMFTNIPYTLSSKMPSMKLSV